MGRLGNSIEFNFADRNSDSHPCHTFGQIHLAEAFSDVVVLANWDLVVILGNVWVGLSVWGVHRALKIL